MTEYSTDGGATLFSLDGAIVPAGPVPPDDTWPSAPSPAGLGALDTLDWKTLYDELDRTGVALTPPLLTRGQCASVEATFDEPQLFRSTVRMERHGYGRGTYKYFADPRTVPLVQSLRESLYPPMARMANRWAAQLGAPPFPDTLRELLQLCGRNGQSKSTPLLLRYGPGDHACLHQDVYGNVVFPLQIAILLDEPDEDFTGGENVFVEQRPRDAQSRAVVLRPRRGQGMIFPVRHRPVSDGGRRRRHVMRHGTNAVGSGRRTDLGIIFHDAR